MKKLAALTLSTLTLSAAISTPSRAILKHREHNGIGYETGYTTAQAFLASKWKNGFMPYADFRGHALNDGHFATNAGLGLRYNWSDYTVGGNFYYDFRAAQNLQPHQLGGGLEFLTNDYDIRLNGYGPFVDTTTEKPARFIKFQGNGAIFKRRFKAALPMIEGEYGVPFGSRCSSANLYGAIGPYYLFEKKVNGNRLGDAIGGQARLVLDVIQLLNIQFNFSYDKIYKWIFQGTGGISIPLGKSKTFSKNKNFFCEARNQLPYRKELIPIECKNKRATSSSRIIFVDNTSSSNGTFESPYPTTALALANSAPRDIIYIFPGDGTPKGYNTQLTMLPNQTIQGSGVPLDLGGGLIVPPQTPNQFPKLTSNSSTITLSRNSTVKGLNIRGTNQAIRSDDPTTPVGGLNRVEHNFVHSSNGGMLIGSAENPVNYVIQSNVVRQCRSNGIQFLTQGTLPNTVNAVLAENSVRNITNPNIYTTTTCISIVTQSDTTLGIALIGNEAMSGGTGIFYQMQDDAIVNSILKRNNAQNCTAACLQFSAENSSQLSCTVKNNNAKNSATTHIVLFDSSDSAQIQGLLQGNNFALPATNFTTIKLEPEDTSSQSIVLERNFLHDAEIGVLVVNVSATNFNVTVDNNLFHNLFGDGFQDNAAITITNNYSYNICNNRFINISNQPIFLSSQVTGVTMQANIQNNVLFGANANALKIEGDDGNVCATVVGNQAPGQGLELEQVAPSVFNIETTTPGSPEGLLEINDFSAVNPTGTINYVPFGTCP